MNWGSNKGSPEMLCGAQTPPKLGWEGFWRPLCEPGAPFGTPFRAFAATFGAFLGSYLGGYLGHHLGHHLGQHLGQHLGTICGTRNFQARVRSTWMFSCYTCGIVAGFQFSFVGSWSLITVCMFTLILLVVELLSFYFVNLLRSSLLPHIARVRQLSIAG